MKSKARSTRARRGIVLAAIVLAMSAFWATFGYAQGPGGNSLDQYFTGPIDPLLAEQLNAVLGKVEQDDVKLRMEITRRIDFYFSISDKIDSLMKTYTESLIPFMYQRDLFQGNQAKNTTSILRTPMVSGVLQFFIQILQPFYALAILTTAIYLLFVSGSPEGRAKAKSTLIKLLLSLGLITLTIPVIEMLLESSQYIASFIMNMPSMKGIEQPIDANMFIVVKEFFMKYFLRVTFFDVLVGFPFLMALILPPISVLVVLSVRYFMIILLTVSFPFIVLFYSFMATKRIGRILIDQLFIWTFVPVIDALILLVTWIAFSSVPGMPGISSEVSADLSAFIVLSGYLMLIIAPVITIWIMNWISSLGLVSTLILRPVSIAEGYFEDSDEYGGMTEEEYETLKTEVQK